MNIIKRIHKDNLSCEAILRKAPDGHLFIVSQCGGDKEPCPENRVYIFHSDKKGSKWSKPILVTPDNGLAQYQTEVSVLDDEILIFMTEHDGNFTSFHSYVLSSKDNGYSFTKKFDLPLKKGFCFVRGMIKKDEIYYFPYQHYNISKKENNRLVDNNLKIWETDLDNVEMGVIWTKDFVEFKCSESPALLPLTFNGKKKWVWSEPTIAELSNGDFIMLLRNDARGYLYKSISSDLGVTWSEPTKTDIPNPANKPKLLKFKTSLVLLNTPQSVNGYSHRNPLSLWISNDDGETWLIKKDIVKKHGWISYPDGFIDEEKNRCLFAFEYNRKDIYFVNCKLPKK